MNKELSVIIVAYNCLNYLERCIKSINKYNDIGERLEIIVVDNGNDNTHNWLNSQSNIIYVKNKNKGFGQGNNVGANYANGKYLLFLNPDTELIEPIFQYAIDIFEKYKDVGSFGFKLLNKENKMGPTYDLRSRMGLCKQIYRRICIKLDIFDNKKMYTSGADMFIRREVFFKCGGFDENIFMYWEEADIANRINKTGYKIAYFKNKSIIHYEGKTEDASLSKKYIREQESREYYCKKYNISYLSEGKKERRYCMLKMLLLGIAGNKTRSNEYKKIVDFWNEKLES